MIYFLCVSDVRAVKLYLPAKQAELDAVLDIRSLDDALALAEHLSEYALEPGLHSLEGLAREELSVIVSDPDRDLLTRHLNMDCLLYTSPSPRDTRRSRMPSSA